MTELERGVARAPGSTTRPGVALSGTVLLAIAAALSSFVVLFDEGPWLASTLITVVAVIAAGLVVRWRVRTWRPLWSVVAALAAWALSLQLQFAADTALLGVVPLAGTLERATELIAAGELSIAEQGIPAEADVGIRFLMAAGVGATGAAGRRDGLAEPSTGGNGDSAAGHSGDSG